MQLVAQGFVEAFEIIVMRHQSEAWRFACRYMQNAEDAKDVVQEAFVRLYKNASRYKPTAKFRTYLFRIITNLCIDFSRKSSKRPWMSTFEDHVGADYCDAQAKLIVQEELDFLERALNDLPARQKAALLLKHYEGLSYKEIARILNSTPKAVESLIARARKKLSASLKNIG